MLVALASLVWAGEVAASEVAGFPLSTPVRQSLGRLHENWQAWQRAYLQDDREAAEEALQELIQVRDPLGADKLPDLAVAAAAYAVRSAEEGNGARARWALEAAQALDPTRPETELARSTVRRREGDYLHAVADQVVGYGRILALRNERQLAAHNALLWTLYALLLSGALFVAVQMTCHGGDLLHDLRALLAPPLPDAVVLGLILGLLLAPLLLPAGLLWLLALWAVLLWGYGSISERLVVVAVVLLLALAPTLLRLQQRQVRLLLSPPQRAMVALEDRQLYGKLFSDLKVLQSTLGQHPAVIELEADLHRRLGQWEQARVRYLELLELEPANAAVLNNLGVYHFRKEEFGNAIAAFQEAVATGRPLAEVFYNLNLAYSQSYAFGDARQALAQAKEVDGARVDRWLAADQSGTVAIPVEGGEQRLGEIRRALQAAWSGDQPDDLLHLLRQDAAPLAAAVFLLLAGGLHLIRRRFGYGGRYGDGDEQTGERLRRAMIPGYASLRRGRGLRAFGGILLLVAALMLPLAGALGYRLPVGYAPVPWLLWIASALALLLVLAVRIGRELAAET